MASTNSLLGSTSTVAFLLCKELFSCHEASAKPKKAKGRHGECNLDLLPNATLSDQVYLILLMLFTWLRRALSSLCLVLLHSC